MFIECHLWVRHCSVTGDTAENTTHKNPRYSPSLGPFQGCSFYPYPECSRQIIHLSHFPSWFFSKEVTTLRHTVFLSFFFLLFCVFLLLCLSFLLSFFPSFLFSIPSSFPVFLPIYPLPSNVHSNRHKFFLFSSLPYHQHLKQQPKTW